MNDVLVGFSRKDITPTGPIVLSGYGDDHARPCEGVLDHIWGSCLALSDPDGNTILLYSVDLCYINDMLTQQLQESVSNKTGIKPEHILIAATHTHAGPSLSERQLPCVLDFYGFFVLQMTQAAKEALKDLSAAQIRIGRSKTEKMNFVRHYITANGTYMGDNFGRRDIPITGHASEADETIQLVRFCREQKQDVLLVNWQAHAKMSSTIVSEFGQAHRRHMSADYIGYTRNELESRTGILCIYFTGAAGNLNADSRISEEAPTKDPAVFGAQLAQFAVKGLADMQTIPGGNLLFRQRQLTLPIDHSDDAKHELAKQVWSLWTQDQEKCKEEAIAAGFNSAYAARDVIRRHDAGESRTMNIHTVKIGALSFVAVPYEMFCVNGMYIKENAPGAMTVIMSCTNGYHNYLPSDFAFTHGSYEVDSRNYPRGSAEKVADALLDMLKEA